MDKGEDSNVDSEDDFLEQAPVARTKVTGRKIKVSGGDFRGSKVGGDTINVFPSTQPGGSRQIEHLPKDTFLLTPNILVYEKDQINAESRILLGELQSDITGNRIIVIKILNDCENARREARTHFRIPLHPNIVRPLFANTFEYRTQACIYIAMECCDVLNLYKYIKLLKKEQCPYNAPLFISFAKQIVNGVIFLHLHNVVNRDLKPQNILLTPDKTVVKICDFGLSKPVAGETTYLTKPQAGTSGWISPEVLKGEKFISVAADIYPLGLMLYHLFSYGDHAFGKDLLSLNHYIMRNMNLNLDNILVPFPELVRELILQMLDQDPSLRPTAKQVRDRLKEIFEGTDTAVQTSLQEKGSIEVVDAAVVHTVTIVKEGLQKASSGGGEFRAYDICTKDLYDSYDDVSSDNPLSGKLETDSYEIPLPLPTTRDKGDMEELNRSDDASYIEPKLIFGSEDKKVQGEVEEILYDETQQILYEDSGSMDDIYLDLVDEPTIPRSETVPNRINVLPVPIPLKNLSSDNIRDEGLYTDSPAVRSSQTPKPRKKTVFEFNDEAFKRGASEYRPKGWRDKSSQGGPPLPSRNTRPRPRSLLAGVDDTFKWESGRPDAFENKKNYIRRTPSALKRTPSRRVPGVPGSTRTTESDCLSFADPENPRGSPGKPPFSGRTQFDDHSSEYEVYEGPTTKESSYVFDRKKTGSTKREDRSVMKSMRKSLKKKFGKKTKQCEYPIGEKAVVDIARSQIRIDNLISSHPTGDISKGIWAPPPIGGQQYAVLTKSPQGTSLDYGELLQEAELMRVLRHQNLLRLLGVVVGTPTVLVMEHPDYGNLYQFLTEGPGRKLLFVDQCNMAAEVASGMSFMEKQNFVHCDLHSENVFVFHASKPVCKVGGFHYADELEDGKRICGEREGYAAKWIAPEVRSDNFFTAKSDIWSFGVLLTEIFSKGKEPYEGMSKAEAQELVQGGYRMTRRSSWPKQLYKIMLICWDEIPTDRPSFQQLLQSINGL